MSFNIRVYGLLLNEKQEVLLTDEFRFGRAFTKFPGGGLKKGEGTLDCLRREFMEECGVEATVGDHFYTTDFYQPSAFDQTQVISIYYFVHMDHSSGIDVKQHTFDFDREEEGAQIFRWRPIRELDSPELSFPIDRKVAEMLKKTFK